MNRASSRSVIWVGPALIYAMLIWFFPLAYCAFLSLTDSPTYSHQWKLIGLQNYGRLILDHDLLNSLVLTVVFVSASVVLHLLGGFAVAHLIRAAGRLRNLLLGLVLIPWTISEIAVALIWRWMFNEQSGLANLLLTQIGLPGQSWLSTPSLALLCLLIAHLWRGLALSTIIQSAGLESIPESLIEAARLDGASPLMVALKIRLPLLGKVLAANAALVALQSLSVFALPYAVTGGGPLRATELISVYLYRLTFTEGRLGYAAAVGMSLLLAFTLIITLVRVQRKKR